MNLEILGHGFCVEHAQLGDLWFDSLENPCNGVYMHFFEEDLPRFTVVTGSQFFLVYKTQIEFDLLVLSLGELVLILPIEYFV